MSAIALYDRAMADLATRIAQQIPFTGSLGDMWAVFRDGALFGEVVAALAEPYRNAGITKVAGIEARGFVLGSAVAVAIGAGFVGIRKPGGLYPGATFERRTPADYRGNEFVLRLQRAAMDASDRAIIVDDWFETGGQASAAVELINESGAKYAGASLVVDWLPSEMRASLGPVHSLLNRETLPEPMQETEGGNGRRSAVTSY